MRDSDKPNVVYILTDQWRAKATGYNGDPNAITPHIDNLAKESVDFANAIGTSPVCTPARACLLTGCFPTTTGMFMNDVPLAPDTESIGKAFKAGGYDTGYIGKWHVDGRGRSAFIPPERRQGFAYWKVLECTHDYQHSRYYDNDDRQIKTWPGYDAFAQTQDAIEYVAAHRDHPFFLVLSLGPPHFPHDNAPTDFQANARAESVVFSPNVRFDSAEGEAFTRQEAAGYYAHIAALDTCVGAMTNALAELGLEENTILVFASDHGEMMGSHNKQPYMKQVFWDESCRVPYLLRYPPLTANCVDRKRMTPLGTVDIMPTLLSLCGLEIPATVEGKDLSACVRNGVEIEEHAALYMSVSPFSGKNFLESAYRAVRTHRYTFVKTVEGQFYLFDDVADPYQLHNLADDPDAAEIRSGLEAELAERLGKINDPFREKTYYLEKWGYETGQYGDVPYAQ